MMISNCAITITTGYDYKKASKVLKDLHDKLVGNEYYKSDDIILTDLDDFREVNRDPNYAGGEKGVMITLSEKVCFNLSNMEFYPKYTDLT